MSAPSIEELREAYDTALDGCEGWQEASALIRSALDELALLRGARQLLRGKGGVNMEIALADVAKLEAENERLRAALVYCKKTAMGPHVGEVYQRIDEALGRKP